VGIEGLLRLRTYAWCALALVLIFARDFRPDATAIAIAPYQFDVVAWELTNLPDKWARRVSDFPLWLFEDPDTRSAVARAERFFEIGQRLRWIDRRLITLEARTQSTAPPGSEAVELRRERDRLVKSQAALRPWVEETLESAIADSLQELGFKAWTGVFPPVDTVLTGSPTFLVLSPRDRIERIEGGLMQTALDNDRRERVESFIENETDRSALVVNTGGLALYPSITANYVPLEYAVEIIAHEWVHQWLWFRPLGRRYFTGPDLTTMNETVATIAGAEIGQLAMARITHDPDRAAADHQDPSSHTHNEPPKVAPRFDFQAEMRATRERVDAMLESGDIAGAEAYMEERRRLFVSEGYPIRRLNQAYFAFHGTYGTTGAAGVTVIGEQVQELRRKSPSLTEFLRTAAQFTSPEDLARYVERNRP
jgi:hypothetical protein